MLLPQSATLTAPSEKEPAFPPLSPADSFAFCPLSLTAFDSFAQPQTATLCLLRRHLPFKGVPKVRAKKKALASPFGRGVIPLIGEMSAKQTKGSGRGTSRTKSVGFFGEGFYSLGQLR